MAYQNFENGVKRYVVGLAVVEQKFPVDWKDREYRCCDMCNFYSHSGKRCNLTRKVCEFPENYVASHCPLMWDDGEEVNRFKKEKKD